jgi:hypothetical protein
MPYKTVECHSPHPFACAEGYVCALRMLAFSCWHIQLRVVTPTRACKRAVI